MKYDSVIFDLDGTLWNATQGIADSWAEALKDAPDISQPPTLQELEAVMGMTPEPLMKKLFPHITKERGQELFRRCCQVELVYLTEHGGILYDGVAETLQSLSEQLPLFIVSNCNDGYIESFLAAHHMNSYFKDWACIGKTGLEKWENIRLIVEKHDLTAPVYLGDTQMDFASASKAGVPFLHAAYGFGRVPDVPAIATFSQLPEALA